MRAGKQTINKKTSASPKPHPSKPRPCNMPQAKTEVALQFSECCAAETALQHWLFCSAAVIWTKSCAAANEKLHCNIEKAALQESGAFLPLYCGFQAPMFRHPRLGPAENTQTKCSRDCPGIVLGLSRDCLGIFLRMLFMCFPFRPRKGQNINKFDPHPFPGQSREVVYVSCV